MKRKEETTFSLSKKEEDNGAADPKKDVSEEMSLSSKSYKNNIKVFIHDLGSMNWAYKGDQYQWSLQWS